MMSDKEKQGNLVLLKLIGITFNTIQVLFL